MNTSFLSRCSIHALIVAFLALGATGAALAQDAHHKSKAPPASTAAVASPEAIAAYPLETCVVSGDVLAEESMGPPVNYVYRQEGKPDRLVRFCCDRCIEKFNRDPQKYLKMIDDAAAAKAKGEKPAPKANADHGDKPLHKHK